MDAYRRSLVQLLLRRANGPRGSGAAFETGAKSHPNEYELEPITQILYFVSVYLPVVVTMVSLSVYIQYVKTFKGDLWLIEHRHG